MATVQEIENLIAPLLAENKFELIETQYRKEAGNWVVRIFVDKAAEPGAPKKGGGITLDDCEKVTNLVGDKLDASEFLAGGYVLEVSSPGINRPLKTEAHFKAAIGQNIKVSLYAPLSDASNQKNFTGILVAVENDELEMVDITSGKVKIPMKAVAKANLELV